MKCNYKSIILTCSIIMFSAGHIMGQHNSYVGLELFGRGGFASAHYLHEFAQEDKKSFWGLGAGFGMWPVTNDFSIEGQSLRGIEYSLPVSVYYVVNNKWEAGVGTTFYWDRRIAETSGAYRLELVSRPFVNVSLGYRKQLGDMWLFRSYVMAIRYTNVGSEVYPWLGIMFARKIK